MKIRKDKIALQEMKKIADNGNYQHKELADGKWFEMSFPSKWQISGVKFPGLLTGKIKIILSTAGWLLNAL